MKKEHLYGILGLIGGALITLIFATNAVNSNNTGMMGMMGMHQLTNQQSLSQGMSQMHEQMMGDDEMTMSGMVNSLKGKSGDEFDKTFLEQMIPHHQGAIDMAKEVKISARHDELKKMADDIISAQTKEIEQMRQWQKDWGY